MQYFILHVLVFPHHAKHFYVDDDESDKLSYQISANSLCRLCWYWRIIGLFVCFSKCHMLKVIQVLLSKMVLLLLYKEMHGAAGV